MTHRVIQLYRGTSAQNDAFTGAAGEITMDTTNKELRLHDGSTAGGHKIGGSIKNQNTAAGATNPIYDWVGTLSEYETQAVATTHPDWICYITDDIGGSATEIGEITEALNNKVDKGFDIIEFQEPTSANNYTWYKKYRNGWVEQGGHYTHNNVQGTVTTTLVIAMADTHYDLQITKEGGSAANATTYYEYMSIYNNNSKTTTSFKVQMTAANRLNGYDWQVSGMAA